MSKNIKIELDSLVLLVVSGVSAIYLLSLALL